jgi:hypothetical protein
MALFTQQVSKKPSRVSIKLVSRLRIDIYSGLCAPDFSHLLFLKTSRAMHFNTLALTLGLAATLGAAVPVDASADANPRPSDIIIPRPPPYFRDRGNDPLDIAELSQPVVRIRIPSRN